MKLMVIWMTWMGRREGGTEGGKGGGACDDDEERDTG